MSLMPVGLQAGSQVDRLPVDVGGQMGAVAGQADVSKAQGAVGQAALIVRECSSRRWRQQSEVGLKW